MKWFVRGLGLLIVLAGLWLFAAGKGWLGTLEQGGDVAGGPLPPSVIIDKAEGQASARVVLRESRSDQILFGDLHVHTTFSPDAFGGTMPMVQGEGAHPLADACDFARYCSQIDFWSINDHALATSARKWSETRRVISECNRVAGDPDNPDMVSYLGWEWTQIGSRPDNHYGHKNVVLRDLEGPTVPARVIMAKTPKGSLSYNAEKGLPFWQTAMMAAWAPGGDRQVYLNAAAFNAELAGRDYCDPNAHTKDLPADCIETAPEPKDLFRKLKEWETAALVIPHGTTWGYYTPPGVSLDKQLKGAQHDPDQQRLIEVFSGHGNSEEYRPWRGLKLDADGKPYCPEPSEGYLPSCWRAGQIIEARCLEAGEGAETCAARAAETRQIAVMAKNGAFKTVPGAEAEDWLEAGQCTDCLLPSFNYRPGNSAQYGLAISSFDDGGKPRRFEFGFMASSDNHQARPGTGYKEFGRMGQTEAVSLGGLAALPSLDTNQGDPTRPRPFDPETSDLANFELTEVERQGSFFMTGGLVAVHAPARDRNSIYDAMERKATYGTSGERILLWFDLLNGDRPVTMGESATLAADPMFEVKAMGSFKQKPGCPDFSERALGPERIKLVCQNECYNPSEERNRIERIEIIRIRPQMTEGENVDNLIEDPWKTITCDPNAPAEAGCIGRFTDGDFAASGRDATYYARVVQEAQPTVNGDNLRCSSRDEEGNCLAVDICFGDQRTDRSDDCLAVEPELAWSSPIFLYAK